MNPFEPVSTALKGVDFTFLTSDEIKKISVKQITNPTTFDSMLHPTPGGLYDPALGAFEDYRCKTCTLKVFTGCPGHCGHIELQGRVYHPIFMDQCLKLLRAKCDFCHQLKMARLEVNRFACKLQLVQKGLLRESEEIDQLQIKSQTDRAESMAVDLDGPSDNEADVDDLMVLRNKFVRDAIQRSRENPQAGVTESTLEARRCIIQDFMKAIALRKCNSCKATSPGYRKDRFLKIFRTPLSASDSARNEQLGTRREEPLVVLNKELRAERRRKRKRDREADEGVADMESSLDEEEESGDSDDATGSEVVALEGVIATEAATANATKGKKASKGGDSEYVNAIQVHAALTLLFEREKSILDLIYNPRSSPGGKASLSADMFFIDTILVPPTRFRPAAKSGGSDTITEDSTHGLYKNVLTTLQSIGDIHRELNGGEPTTSSGRRRTYDDLNNSMVALQAHVNGIIDSTKNPNTSTRLPEEGIKQVLEKKEGLFRMNMMGKRVNFAARSVISPDPNLETSEIGVPPVFAKKLNYAEAVTPFNYHWLKTLVLNGPEQYPGAVAIEDEFGRVISLAGKSAEERMAMANSLQAPSTTAVNGARNKKVHRHLRNGDMVIMNRQPTLHKPSMMAHIARVLPGEKTIRMHYANCNTYNADFDGDEMNMHFPQNEIARAEALLIADTDHQYFSATAGKPLRGLIQDHISMALQVTNRDVFYTREEYQQLLYGSMRPEENHTTSGRILTVPPAILKPVPLWTGKQIITTLLRNITPETHAGLHMSSKSSTPAAMWGPDSEEQQVLITDGELVQGVLDKSQIGPAGGGLVHMIHEAYGERAAGKFLSLLGRLLTKVLHSRAFSCGVEDLVLTPEGEATRNQMLAKAPSIGLEVAAKYVTLEDRQPKADDPELKKRLEGVLRDDQKQAGLDELTKMQNGLLASEVTKKLLPEKLVKPFPKNQMQAMTGSGAKGSGVNANLISCQLGQQVLEGRRVPTMVSGKTLPSFLPYETNIRAGGFITQRFLTGIKPQEYYFHAMAGREGLIDTAVKTSRSGYLQRCLVKGLENMRVEYDSTVRDSSSGDVVQFLYGEDGLDVARAKNLTDFSWIAANFMSVYANLDARDKYSLIRSEEAEAYNKKAVKMVSKSGDLAAAGFDPVINVFSPAKYAGSTSEKFYRAAKKYRDDNPQKLLKEKKDSQGSGEISKKSFETLLNLKYLRSLVEPGESVGIVAGQSVGEPSTQMTLNTFHLAGHASKNVTLGIPRLREIVMTASANIGTPLMIVHLNNDISPEVGQSFAKGISRLSLAEIMDSLSLSESVGKGTAYQQARIFRIKLNFFPAKEYTGEYAISVLEVLDTVGYKFLPRLQLRLRQEWKKMAAEVTDAKPEVGKSSGPTEEQSARAEELDDGDGEDDDEGGDGDGTNAKQAARRKEMISYDDADEEEDIIRRQAQREASPDEDEAYGSRENTPAPRDAVSQQRKVNGTGPLLQADDAEASSDGEEDDEENPYHLQGRITESPAEIEERIKGLDSNKDVSRFSFDPSGNSCTFTLEYPFTAAKLLVQPHVEAVLKDSVIKAIPGINSCVYDAKAEWVEPGMDGRADVCPAVNTEGINIPAMWEHQDVINPHRILSNSVHHMLRHYGIEAARATIVNELNAVFQGHSITVDMRHLTLIADTMTRHGTYKAFSRSGLMKNMVSVFAKMSFETTVGFLKDALLEGEREELKNPSARIVMGALSGVGTGSFDVLTRVPKGVTVRTHSV